MIGKTKVTMYLKSYFNELCLNSAICCTGQNLSADFRPCLVNKGMWCEGGSKHWCVREELLLYS